MPVSKPHNIQLSGLTTLQKRLHYRFKHLDFLKKALVHASLLPQGVYDFDRLELLGDKILGGVVGAWVFQAFPQDSEGDLSKRFTRYTRAEFLSLVSKDLGLAEFLHWGSQGGKNEPGQKILADGCEALLGAIFLDGGFEAAREVVHRFWAPYMEEAVLDDPKTELQEYVQKHYRQLPQYRTLKSEGPNHSLTFTVELSFDRFIFQGQGPTKKAAQRGAAKKAILALATGSP